MKYEDAEGVVVVVGRGLGVTLSREGRKGCEPSLRNGEWKRRWTLTAAMKKWMVLLAASS